MTTFVNLVLIVIDYAEDWIGLDEKRSAIDDVGLRATPIVVVKLVFKSVEKQKWNLSLAKR